MIHQTCFKCKRRFDLDPVLVGFELLKLKKKQPDHYQAVCPGCRTINKVSVQTMQAELDEVSDEVAKMFADYEAEREKQRAEAKARAKEKRQQSSK